jgi:hypothetical protein
VTGRTVAKMLAALPVAELAVPTRDLSAARRVALNDRQMPKHFHLGINEHPGHRAMTPY